MIWNLRDAVRGYRELVKENFLVFRTRVVVVRIVYVGAVERKKVCKWRGRVRIRGNPGIRGTAVLEMGTSKGKAANVFGQRIAPSIPLIKS